MDKSLLYFFRGYRLKAGNGRYNVGIQKRLDLFKEKHPDLENIDVDDKKLDNLESGILEDGSSNDYSKRREGRSFKNIIEYKSIERKYFKKQIYPNFLSWSEKSQIRFLFNSDPKTWSPERLSESFPATIDIIKKLIKSNWKPMASDRIVRHDKAVCDNWKALENGIVKLPDYLENHIKKFVSRRKAGNLSIPDKALEEVKHSTNTSCEFLNIIKTFSKKTCSHNLTEEKNYDHINLKPSHKNETYVLNVKNDLPLKHKYYTLGQLKKELMSNTPNDSINEKYETTAKECEPDVVYSDYSIPQSKYNQCSAEQPLMNKDYTEEIPLKMNIPKEKINKSKTQVYKVKDCYYDHNGDFLFKVPGMV